MTPRANHYKLDRIEYLPHPPYDLECVVAWGVIVGMVAGFWVWVLIG